MKNLEYLSSEFKRLLYVSSTNHELISSSQSDLERLTVEITDAGKGYVNVLGTDLAYVQKCFYSLDWDIKEFNNVKATIEVSKLNHFINGISNSVIKSYLQNVISKGYNINDIPSEVWESTAGDRFLVVRKMLSLMLLSDILQVVRYLYNNVGPFSNEIFCNEIIINNTLSGLAHSILNILRVPYEAGDIKAIQEIDEWYSLIIMGNYLEKTLLGNENRNLNLTIKKYNELRKKFSS